MASLNKDHVAKVHKAITTHKGQATLKDIVKATNLPYRVVHNLTWRMEGSPKGGVPTKREELTIKRTNLGRVVTYGKVAKGESTTFNHNPNGKYATKGFED